MRTQIDLNCDLGEWKNQDGYESDKAIMPFISSCNIACGGHIGDEISIMKTIELAQNFDVAIGAHPGYPDKENFGRVVLEISPDVLYKSIVEQIEEFLKYVERTRGKLHHIKPHGALYNHAIKDETTAKTMLNAIQSVVPEAMIYLPPNSISAAMALELGFKVIYEAFADRRYEDDLSLRSRTLSGAVLDDEEEVIDQLEKLLLEGVIQTYSGEVKSLHAETVCLHSDTPGAIELAKTINKKIRAHGVSITSP